MDEFDAVAKMRDDAHEVGEVKRLVGSLLQNFDRVQGHQIVIAATNHDHMLDPAIWRRFDVTLRLDYPSEAEIPGIIANVIPEGGLTKKEIDAVAVLAHGMSGSDIAGTVKRALQDMFLFPNEQFGKRLTLGVLAKRVGLAWSNDYAVSKKELIVAIRQCTAGNLTPPQIAGLVGCSPAYAYGVVTSRESKPHDDQ